MFQRLITSILLLVLCQPIWAQQAAMEFIAPDSLDVTLFVDGNEIERAFTLGEDGAQHLLLDSLTPSIHYIDVLIEDSLQTYLRTDLTLDTVIVPKLRLIQNANSFTLQLDNAAEALQRNYTSIESVSRTLDVQVNVSVEAGCAPPASPLMMQTWNNEIDTFEFERDREKLLKQVLGVSCLTTQQISSLLHQVEDEERRLDLLKRAYSQCFNKHAYQELETLLYLTRSKENFKEWLSGK
ncbi:MAG: hypothetical protein ACI87M_000577 [Yoonia sp.]|jgi:hypothetical protein